MRVAVVFLLSSLSFLSTAWSQQMLVFPAVADQVAGQEDSLWRTIVRLVKRNPFDSVTVRRKWVCVPGGGFADAPGEAPSWDLTGTGPDGRMVFLSGGDLLQGTNKRLGAVALEVIGGEVLAHAHVLDASQGLNAPGVVAFGLGQSFSAIEEPLEGPSSIPWMPSCRQPDCQPFEIGDILNWEFTRNNIGVVNPNPEPLEVTGDVIVFAGDGKELEYEDDAFAIELLPYEWAQFQWHADQDGYGWDFWGFPYFPDGGFILNLIPNQDSEYFAYASVVFSPDPSFSPVSYSDPMFVPAVPGYIQSAFDTP